MVWEKLYLSVDFLKSISGFPRFLDVLIGQKLCWKAAAVVMKLYWKPISKILKGFRKPIKNRI
jgi:hypothetical protein